MTPGIEIPTLLIDFAGIALWAAVYFMQKVRIKKDPSLTLPIEERKARKKALASQRV